MLGGSARAPVHASSKCWCGGPDAAAEEAFERLLYLARKESEARLSAAGLSEVYVASLSGRTLVYKGLLTAVNLPYFYLT